MAEGVTVGIILRRQHDRHAPFGPMTAFFERVVRAGDVLNVHVVGFGPDDIHRRQDRLDGIVWDFSRSRFVAKRVRMPDLVWDRMKGARGEPAVRYLRGRGVPLLNTVALNKWEAIQLLSRDPVLRGLMPNTCLLGDPRDALEMLHRHGRAYLKPVVGSMGRGILRLLRKGRRVVGQSVSQDDGYVRSELLAESDLEDWLDDQTGGRQYLVQQGLHLEVFSGRTADIRVLMQKDGRGIWRLTGMGARVGAPGRFTSNLHTGGQGVPVPGLLEKLMPGEPERQAAVTGRIGGLSLHLCRVLERAMGPLAEIGIDLGLEPDGRLWYIEHNYYPGRSIFSQLRQPAVWETAHRRPLEYAVWAVRRLRQGLPLLLPEPRTAPAAPQPQAPVQARRLTSASAQRPAPAAGQRPAPAQAPAQSQPPAPPESGEPGTPRVLRPVGGTLAVPGSIRLVYRQPQPVPQAAAVVAAGAAVPPEAGDQVPVGMPPGIVAGGPLAAGTPVSTPAQEPQAVHARDPGAAPARERANPASSDRDAQQVRITYQQKRPG